MFIIDKICGYVHVFFLKYYFQIFRKTLKDSEIKKFLIKNLKDQEIKKFLRKLLKIRKLRKILRKNL